MKFKDCIEAEGRLDAYGYGVVNDPRTKKAHQTYGYRKELADMFNISVHAVADITSGRTWQEVSS